MSNKLPGFLVPPPPPPDLSDDEDDTGISPLGPPPPPPIPSTSMKSDSRRNSLQADSKGNDTDITHNASLALEHLPQLLPLPPPPPPPPPDPSTILITSKHSYTRDSKTGIKQAKRSLSEVAHSELKSHTRKYRKLTSKRTKVSTQHKKTRNFNIEMPPEYLRKLLDNQSNMTSKRFDYDKKTSLGALRYMPHAILKLLENMPQPWESFREVKVIYHITGAITFVNELPRIIEPVYLAQWSAVWVAMRREKRDRKHFKRIRFPVFDDDEPFLSYTDHIADLEPLSPINLELDGTEDAAIKSWIYDTRPLSEDVAHVNGPSYKAWRLPLKTMANLYRLATPLRGEFTDRNAEYLFERDAFITGKALNNSLPGGPKFEPLYRHNEDEDLDDFNSIDRIIFRINIRSEYKIAFSHLYNNFPRSIRLLNYHEPMSCLVRAEEEGSRTVFAFDRTLNHNLGKTQQLFGKRFKAPEKFPASLNPLLSGEVLESEDTESALLLYHAPFPFNKRCGRTKRAQDVSIVKRWYSNQMEKNTPLKVKVSHQKLLKNYVSIELRRRSRVNISKTKLLKTLSNTRYFQRTTLDWVEAGLQLCKQGHNMLNLLLHKRGLTFLHLDNNFNLKPTKTLTTKERKKSRFGHAFHLIRELLKLMKLLVDIQVQYRIGHIDSYQLADGIYYILNHIGQLTGIYRYKYRVMHQIRACKDLKHLVYYRFNKLIGKGPGCGFWQPAWRIWIFFIRGTIPLLERWIGNLLNRQFEGRSNEVAKTTTKQRSDAYYDLELRSAVMNDIMEMMPQGVKEGKARTILQHLSEAWRCWKANIEWDVPGMPEPIKNIIEKYIKAKSDGWLSSAHKTREKIRRGRYVEKAALKKNIGRLTRLWMKTEQERQTENQKFGPEITPNEAITVFNNVVDWLSSRNFRPISFPPITYKNDSKILVLALENLKENFASKSRLSASEREELALIEEAFDNPHTVLTRIKKFVLTQRVFKPVDLQMVDHFQSISPVYKIDPLEKIVDAYLDQYLWFEAQQRNLFPNWVKPSDQEIPPHLVYKWSQGINNLDEVWDTSRGQSTVIMESTFEHFADKIDFTLLNRLLRLVVDSNIADYMTAKNNVIVNFKDMTYLNKCGLIKGVHFSSFLFQYLGLVCDLMLLGNERAAAIAGPPSKPNNFMDSKSDVDEKSHPLKFYLRYLDKIYILFRFEQIDSNALIEKYLQENPDPNFENLIDYGNKTCWPRDARMRLVRYDVNLGRAIFWKMKQSLPDSLAEMNWNSTFVSVYSKNNPNLVFTLCGFEIRIIPNSRTDEVGTTDEGVWDLMDHRSGKRSAKAFLKVSQAEVERFASNIRGILISSGSATFTRVTAKWNTALLALFTYFREAIISTDSLLDVLVKSETKVQNKVKLGLNSKMPTRFPPAVFYTPKELGGLGMISASHILIPASDLRWSKQTDVGITHFRAGMSHEQDQLIPTIFRYITTWENEFNDSQRTWLEYSIKREEAMRQNRRLAFEELESCWDRGIPRINTLFQRDRHTLAYDKGYRVRMEFKKYTVERTNPFWWTNSHHDGKLWNINAYRTDVIQALGGIETILEHTLFKGTGFSSWEGLFWEKASGFEDSMQFKKLTHAQRTGLSQIPNRRFTLWWSPTINRANVYVGFVVQLDLTGIFLHGKIPTLKISLIQIFRAHLWQKIHESVVFDICQILDGEKEVLLIESVDKESVHPRKSYKMNSSAADVIIKGLSDWDVARPSMLHDANDSYNLIKTSKMWIDVQLRYGDYDSHDISRYVRAKFLDYTTDNTSMYPTPTGLMIGIDLAYNMYDAYGNWMNGLKPLMQNGMKTIMKANPALYVLRERIRKGLQIYQSNVQEPFLSSSNYAELFNSDVKFFVDDHNVYRVTVHRTLEGNVATRPINGCIFTLNPKTGHLFLKIIHTSVWTGQKRLSQLAKWKTAEEVSALIRSLPKEEQPKQVIVTRKAMLDPLEVHLLDFPNIAIRPTELRLPFSMILSNDKLSDVVSRATEPQMALFNIYDDWLSKISSYTAFSRLILILRGLKTNEEAAKMILLSDPTVPTKEHHLWPSFNDQQWIEVESRMRDLILTEYGKKYNVKISSLTQTEIKDIILGQNIKAPSVKRQKMAELAATNSGSHLDNADKGLNTVMKTKTVNAQGEEMVVVTSSNYENKVFQSQIDWRRKAIANSLLYLRLKNIYVSSDDFVEEKLVYVLPRNLLEKFVIISDVQTQVGAYIYGSSPPGHDNIKEVKTIAIVPQLGSNRSVSLSQPPSTESNSLFNNLELLGWMHTQTDALKFMSAIDVKNHTQLFGSLSNMMIDLTVYSTSGSVSLSAYNLTLNGYKWAHDTDKVTSLCPPGFEPEFSENAQLLVSDRFTGNYLVPSNKIWNYTFMNINFNRKIVPKMMLGTPYEFYNEIHRVTHFTQFVDSSNGDDKEAVEDLFE